MTSVEKTAKTVDEAVQLALTELGVPRERAQVEVLEEGRPLFGILGAAQARVRVTAQMTVGERAARMLTEMIRHMGIEGTTRVVEEDDAQAMIDIEGGELGLLIGKHGQTLAAVQHLLGLMANKGQEPRKRIILDAQGYRERREESLRHLALASARKAKQSGEPVTLDPLLPHERRIIHTALAEDSGVATRSVGEDPTRRIVIEPKGAAEGDSQRHSDRGMRFRALGRDEPRYGPRRKRPSREQAPEAAEDAALIGSDESQEPTTDEREGDLEDEGQEPAAG
jgi:spoIIIJ-associated protein